MGLDDHQRLRSRLREELSGDREVHASARTSYAGRMEGARAQGVFSWDCYAWRTDELKDTYRLQCWYGIEADPRGVKQVMWLEILPEFSYKPQSIWLSSDDQREQVLTHKAWWKETDIAVGLHFGVQEVATERATFTMVQTDSRTMHWSWTRRCKLTTYKKSHEWAGWRP